MPRASSASVGGTTLRPVCVDWPPFTMHGFVIPVRSVAAVVIDKSPSQNFGERKAQTDRARAEIEKSLEALGNVEPRFIDGGGEDRGNDGTRLFSALNLALADVPPERMSRATSLGSMVQQLAQSVGVAFGAMVLHLTVAFHGNGAVGASDFFPAFAGIALVSLAAILFFLPLAHVFARFIEVIAVHAGVKVGHQPDAKTVATAMVSFKPNWLLAVPRVFEKVYNSAEQKAEGAVEGVEGTALDRARDDVGQDRQREQDGEEQQNDAKRQWGS